MNTIDYKNIDKLEIIVVITLNLSHALSPFVQEIAYFDEPVHSTGALTARLATDATGVQGVCTFICYHARKFAIFRFLCPFFVPIKFVEVIFRKLKLFCRIYGTATNFFNI